MKLASQRPVEECRTFRSEHVEKVIADVTNKMADKDLARLFENCFANTLDTTIRWHLPDYEKPQSFVITGDMYIPPIPTLIVETLNGYSSSCSVPNAIAPRLNESIGSIYFPSR